MHPLQDLKILDFTTLLPGPMATMYMADWGAQILRIEAPDREDLSRTMPPFVNGTSTTHAFLNRSKQSLSLDLKDPLSRQKVIELLAEYDVIIEQFRPGVMARLGLDYESLSALQPRLIYCSLTGYGQTGPYQSRAGHDINYAALSGLAAVTGSQAHGPALVGSPVCDLAGSYHAVIALLMAALHREKTGEGQAIDISITDSSLMLSSLWSQMALAAQRAPTWESTALNGATFYGYYRTQDGKFLSVGSLEPKFLKGFLEAIDGLEMLQLNPADRSTGTAMKRLIQERIMAKTQQQWMEIFHKLDVCVEPVLSLEEVIAHPQFAARSMIVDVDIGNGTKQKQLGSPLRFSKFRPVYRHAGVQKGAHNHLYTEFGSRG